MYNIRMIIVTVASLAGIRNKSLSLSQTLRIFVATITITSGFVYIVWRASTLSFDSLHMAIGLYLAEFLGILQTVALLYTVWPRKKQDYPKEGFVDKSVYIFVPTVDEGRAIIEPTIRGVIAATESYKEKYPKAQFEIVICNDGYVAGYEDWEQAEEFAKEVGVTCVTRTVPGGAKAGNIEHARQKLDVTGDKLLVIFDSDQVPEVDFFHRMLPPFRDDTVGWVQTGQHYRNTEHPIANWADKQNELFFNIIMPNKENLNAVIICGTNFVIRAEALDMIGGLPQDTITEDIAAALLLNGRWRSIYIADELVTGLGPMTMDEYYSQQLRWSAGNLGIGLKYLKELLFGGKLDLTFAQRMQYLISTSNYICGIRDFMYIIAPISYLLMGIKGLDHTHTPVLLWHSIPYWISTLVCFLVFAWKKVPLKGILMNFITFPIYMLAFITVISGKKLKFRVTSKEEGASAAGIRHFTPQIVICVLAILAGLNTPVRYSILPGATLTVFFWLSVQSAILFGMFWLLFEARPSVNVRSSENSSILKLSQRPIVGLYASLICVIVLGGFLITQPTIQSQQNFDMVEGDFASTYQHPDDRLNHDWLVAVEENNQVPWVVLDFTKLDTPDHLKSALAVTNGFYDSMIQQLAQDIDTYDVPLILTLKVDESLGYQGDLENAWQRIEWIFADAGTELSEWNRMSNADYKISTDGTVTLLSETLPTSDAESQIPRIFGQMSVLEATTSIEVVQSIDGTSLESQSP